MFTAYRILFWEDTKLAYRYLDTKKVHYFLLQDLKSISEIFCIKAITFFALIINCLNIDRAKINPTRDITIMS